MARPDQQLAAIHHLVDEARRRWPAARAHAASIAADGHRRTTTGSGGSKGGISDPTANAAIARTTGTGTGYLVTDLVQAAEQAIRNAAGELGELLAIIDKLSPPPGDTPRCSGGAGIEGALEFGDPTCTRVPDGRPSRSGMCDACYQRYDRWRRVPRTAGAA